AVLLAQAGHLAPPVLLKILLSGSWATGPFPTEEAIEFHLRQLPDGLDVEWLLVPHGIADPTLVERLCRRALELGGGIRVGIGDNPLAARGRTNAELVDEAARWAHEAGRPIATAADLRERLGIADVPHRQGSPSRRPQRFRDP
ncbi:MAG: 3-keto-5-aminohexanoate cleavage protein, partial [Candidatus Rokuibacteriota bacterium]